MAVNSLFVLMCRYTHCVKVYPLGGVWVNHQPQFAFDAPIGWGFPSQYCCDVWYGKIRMVLLPMVKKIEDMFIRFDRMPGLPWGLNFNPHTHPIPIPMGIPIPTAALQNACTNVTDTRADRRTDTA